MLKVLSLFSGMGAFEKALERLEFDYDLVNYCEINQTASKIYSTIHNINEDKNLVDVTTINTKELRDFDLMSWGFPCTDLSISGKQKGFHNEDGSKTRSGLYYEGIRILRDKKPKYSIIENVKALSTTKFKNEFMMILKDLQEAGYDNYYQTLNSKYFDVPQDRERFFIVSIRKDLHQSFNFPIQKSVTKKRICDILDVDANSYLKSFMSERLKHNVNKHKANLGQLKVIGNITLNGRSMSGRVYCANGLSPTLVASTVNKLRTLDDKIRYYTTKECFLLMGFDEIDHKKCVDAGISKTQLYKAAGNSIVVPVLEAILSNLLLEHNKSFFEE